MRTAMMLGLVLVLSVITRAGAQTDAQSEVSQAMEALRQASLANDAEKLHALLADDCTLVLVSGRLVTKPQYLSFVRGGSIVFDALSYEDVVIRVYGSAAVVTHILNIKERIGGAAPTTGRFRSTRVLVKSERGWRFVAFQSSFM
jgi:ketosteroid isomerase-like protein